MPTTVTSSIGSGGGRDYSTITAWEAACPANLVSDDKIWRGECYNDAAFNEAVMIIGATTDATRYIELTAASGQSFQDHASVRSNALRVNQANGVAIIRNGLYETLLDSRVSYTRISRLQIQNTSGSGRGLSDPGVSANDQIWKDIITDCTRGSSDALQCAANILGVNIVSIQRASAGDAFSLFNGGTLIGCLAIKPSDVTPGGTGFGRNYGAPVLTSCAVFGFTTAVASSGSWSGSSSNNATDLASGLPGSSNQHAVTYTQTTPFTDADKDSLDLRSIASTALAANGFLDATNAPNDISGTARAANPTIGAWELTAAPAGGTYPGADGCGVFHHDPRLDEFEAARRRREWELARFGQQLIQGRRAA